MATKRQNRSDPKAEALREQGSLNPKAKSVTDPLFQEDDFFDPRDLVQVKYEMVRRVKQDGATVTGTVRAFGFSRPAFYQAQAALEKEGLPGLAPKKRGPRGGHKVTAAVSKCIEEELQKTPSMRTRELLERIEEQCGLHIHRRTLERAVDRLKKKRP